MKLSIINFLICLSCFLSATTFSYAEKIEFYILRHGETWANREQIAQGALNNYKATLTLEGMQVADKEAAIFANYLNENHISIDKVYVSPAIRTNQTAQMFLQYFTPSFIDRSAKAFGPQPWGILDGQSLNTIVTETGDKAVDYAYINRDWKPASCEEFPESESVNETTQRVLLGISDVYQKLIAIDPAKEWTVVIVTHSDTIKPLLEYITGELPKGRIPNCKVHRISMSGLDESTRLPQLTSKGIISSYP